MLKISNISVQRGAKVTLDTIELSLAPGKTLAVVGESGAGKSTLIAAILGLTRLQQGSIHWHDQPVQRCRPSLVMQEPRAAFNPALTLRHSILEPIRAIGADVPHQRLTRLCEALELPVGILDRHPDQVSIGQAQRAGIMRALISKPPLILFDEPLSALDAVAQKRTAKLIAELQREEGFAALIVTHDLGYAVAYADEIAVLKAGKVEERATPVVFVEGPKSTYCESLRAAAISLGSLEVAA